MEFSVGVGLTNACDLACAHCYRDTDRIDQLTLAEVTGIYDALPVRSMNLGTGENGLHPDYDCPLVRDRTVHLDWAAAESRELLKTGSACTSVFAPA